MGAPMRLVLRLEIEKEPSAGAEPEVVPLSVSRMEVGAPIRDQIEANEALFMLFEKSMKDLIGNLASSPAEPVTEQFRKQQAAKKLIPVRARVFAKMIRASMDCFPHLRPDAN